MKKSFFKSTLASSLLIAGVAAFAKSSLENPSPNSYQSEIGIISGWACNATESQVEVLIDGKYPLLMATGTSRGDTSDICRQVDTGVSYLTNFNNFGAGQHTAQLRINGQPQGMPVSFTVVVPAGEFARGLNKEVSVPDFPVAGSTTVLVWQESSQNFAIKSVSASGENSGSTNFPNYLAANYQCSAGSASGKLKIDASGLSTLNFQDMETGVVYTGSGKVSPNGDLSANGTGSLGSIRGSVTYSGTFVLLQGSSRPQGAGQWFASTGDSGSWICLGMPSF